MPTIDSISATVKPMRRAFRMNASRGNVSLVQTRYPDGVRRAGGNKPAPS
jgi:hypothetical protein